MVLHLATAFRPVLRRDEAAVLVFAEVSGVRRHGQVARLHVDMGEARNAAADWGDRYGGAEMAGYSHRFHLVDQFQPPILNFVEFTEHMMTDAGLVHHHGREPIPGYQHRER